MKFIEDSYSFGVKIKSDNNNLGFSNIFSDYVMDKIEVFEQQIKIPYPNDIIFVCEYNRARNYSIKEIDPYTADYYMARKNNKGDIILLGLKEQKTNTYGVQTSRIIRKDDDQMNKLKDLLKEQVITYVNSVNIQNDCTGYEKICHLSIDDKREKIQYLITLQNLTNTITNTTKNHLFDIKGISRMKNDTFNKKYILSQLVNSMQNRTIFDINELDDEIRDSIDEEILELIKCYNDSACSNYSSKENIEKYSELQSEKTSLIDENNKLTDENNDLKQQVEDRNKEINNLKIEVENLRRYKEICDEFTNKTLELTNKN